MRNRTHIGKTKSADASITHYIYKNFVSSTKFTIFARHIIKREKEYSLTENIYNNNDKKKEQRDATRFRGYDSRGEH